MTTKLKEQTRTCVYCGVKFVPVAALQVFCTASGSASCKKTFEREAYILGHAALMSLLEQRASRV